jgi:hypothetical protein
MDIGMLWFDDSTRTTDEKIQRAVAFYAEKYGRTPTVCMVNPTTAEDDAIVGGVQVRPARSVLPHHFLVGIEDEKPNGRSSAGMQLQMDLKVEVVKTEVKRPKRARNAATALDGQAA